MDISAINGLGPQFLDPDNDRVPRQTLDSDDFFRLLTVQLQNQDPLNPIDDLDFIAQMAQFSSLQLTRELVQSFDNFNTSQSFFAAQSFLGREITGYDEAGEMVVGIVTAVKLGPVPVLTVNNAHEVEVFSVVESRLPPSS